MNTIGWAIVYAALTWEIKGRVDTMDKDTRLLYGVFLFFVILMMTISTIGSFLKG